MEIKGVINTGKDVEWAFQVALVVKNLLANAGDIRDTDSIPRSSRSPGGGHGNPLQYACLENPMDGEAWWAKNQTRLKQQSMHSLSIMGTPWSNATWIMDPGSVAVSLGNYWETQIPTADLLNQELWTCGLWTLCSSKPCGWLFLMHAHIWAPSPWREGEATAGAGGGVGVRLHLCHPFCIYPTDH